MTPDLPMSLWTVHPVDNSLLTTVTNMVTNRTYTIAVLALTNVGDGPLSEPIRVKTQQGGKRANNCLSNNVAWSLHLISIRHGPWCGTLYIYLLAGRLGSICSDYTYGSTCLTLYGTDWVLGLISWSHGSYIACTIFVFLKKLTILMVFDWYSVLQNYRLRLFKILRLSILPLNVILLNVALKSNIRNTRC